MIVAIIFLSVLIPILAFVLMVLNRKKNYPEKSIFNCFLNIALGPLRMLRLGPYKQGSLTMDKAIKYALKKVKGAELEDMSFVDNFRVLTETDTYKSLKMTNLGYILCRLESNLTVTRRLKFLTYIKEMPQIQNVPLRSPVFVTGLPRTGTTFLHRLLSLDPAVRSPLLWELLQATPNVKGESKAEVFAADREKRARFIRKLVKDRKAAGDSSLDHIHEIDADLPEECLMSLADELPLNLNYFYALILHWKKFFTEIDQPKVAAAFRYYKKVLQLLSYQIGEAENPRRWVLKCPIHMYYVKPIAEVFPDAKFIWTHRHPQAAVPSMCSLVKAMHQVYYENECRDDAAIGRAVSDMTAHNLQNAPKDFQDTKVPCANITYNDLIKDPIAVVKSIYTQFGWEFTPAYEAIIKEYLAEDKRKRDAMKKGSGGSKGKVLHRYTPEEFSLTTEELSSGVYADYIKRYNVPLSSN